MPKRKAAAKETKGAADFSSFLAQINKDDSVINLTEREEKFYKFGDYNLDRALGGGLPAGQVYAFQGPPSSGKSLAALSIAKQVIDTEEDGRVIYFDTEAKISQKALAMIGVKDNQNFVHLTINNLEETLNKVSEYAETGLFKLIVVDSLDSLITDEQEGRDIHEGSKVGGYKAKVLSEWLPQVVHSAAANNCAVLFVQQQRLNPGAMFGNPATTSSGEAIKHYVTTRLSFGPFKDGNAEENGKLSYQGANVRILKTNQGAAPKDSIGIRFYIGDDKSWGIDPVMSVLDESIRLGVFAPKSATSHTYLPCQELCSALDVSVEELTFNGKNNLLKALTNDVAFFETVRSVVDEYIAEGKTNSFEEEAEEAVEFEELED